MRSVIDAQMMFGSSDISSITFNPKSRDDIPQLLRGLQFIYLNLELRQRIFSILKEVIPPSTKGEGKASALTGRPGMSQWVILVLGTLRLGLNEDYDRILELANEHGTLRQMLGHGDSWADKTHYHLQTLKDNLALFTPEILDKINQEVVASGHQLFKKKEDEPGINTRCDSFVVETNVHFPTDTNLLWDAMRIVIEQSAQLSLEHELTYWRQHQYQLRQLKKQYRLIQKLKHSTSKDEGRRTAKVQEIRDAHSTYLQMASGHLLQVEITRDAIKARGGAESAFARLDTFVAHAVRQIDQIRRRVLEGETIPHAEKVFSLFQPHTEWISKGKAGVPVELGLRVCIVEDQYRFILHHQVMEKTTDDAIAVSIMTETVQRFSRIQSISMDKGFHSPDNQTQLKALIPQVVLPKKGKLSVLDRERQTDPEFIRLRRQHSAVESAINALEQHGLDICPDHGIAGFKRYVAMAVVARNIQRLGAVLRQQEVEREQRRRGPYRKAA
jgi:IS5 family transposase